MFEVLMLGTRRHSTHFYLTVFLKTQQFPLYGLIIAFQDYNIIFKERMW